MQTVRSVAFVGESHCGSKYAIWPHPTNEAQERLLVYWKDFWKKCDIAQVDTVCWMGEFVDGINPNAYGAGLVTENLNEQMEEAISLLEPHIKDRELRVITGSDYHVKALTLDTDKAITLRLNGKHKDEMCNLTFPPSNLIFNIAHDMSAATVYRSSGLNKEMVFAHQAEALKLLPVDHYDVMVRGHIHDFFYIRDRKMHGILTPCWKCYHPIRGKTKYHARLIPAIGGVIVHITDTDDLIVQPELYPTPHVLGRLEEVEWMTRSL